MKEQNQIEIVVVRCWRKKREKMFPEKKFHKDLVFLAIVFHFCSEYLVEAAANDQRIINGKPEDYFALVQLTIFLGLGLARCDGSLFHPKYVITAGHCVRGAQYAYAVMGKQNNGNQSHSQLNIVASFYLHPLCVLNATTFEYDVGIMELKKEFTLNNYVRLTELYFGPVPVNTTAEVYGDGIVHDGDTHVSPVVNKIDTNVVANAVCGAYYGKGVSGASVICLHGDDFKSTCSGDSGGPLLTTVNGKRVQIGTTSYGSSLSCEMGAPTGSFRVACATSFIEDVTGEVQYNGTDYCRQSG